MKLKKILHDMLSESKDKYEVTNVYLNGRRVSGITTASSDKHALANVIYQNLSDSQKGSIALKINNAKEIKGYKIKKLPPEPDQPFKKHWTDIDENKNSNYSDLVISNVEKVKHHEYFSIKDPITKGHADLDIRPHFNHDTLENDGLELCIIEFYASPIENRILNVDNKGGGFGRNVFAKIFEICADRGIKILSIFAPLKDSQDILKHYTDIGLLDPISYSKAVYGDFYTSFKINPSKSIEYSKNVQSKKDQIKESPTDISYDTDAIGEWDNPKANKKELLKVKKQAKLVGDKTVGGKQYVMYTDIQDKYTYFYFLNPEQTVLLAVHSFIDTNIDGRPAIQNSYIWKMKSEKGFMKSWFEEYVIKKYPVIVSDISLSKFGLSFWKWLFSKFVKEKGGKMIVYDKGEKKKIPIKSAEDLNNYHDWTSINKIFVLYRTN